MSEPRYGVTSFADLHMSITMHALDAALQREFESVFG